MFCGSNDDEWLSSTGYHHLDRSHGHHQEFISSLEWVGVFDNEKKLKKLLHCRRKDCEEELLLWNGEILKNKIGIQLKNEL